MRAFVAFVVPAFSLALWPAAAAAETFEPGSLIIPMDTDHQDEGMLEAYGLVYELIKNDVHVHWVIKSGKGYGDTDFIASSIDIQTSDVITDHGYRGGPWVIDVADADAALAIIDAWHTDYPAVNVHEATTSVTGDVAHVLTAAPTIAMLADGNQAIARKYMQAAKIPDSTGDLAWADGSPDMLTPDEVAGASDTDHADGALFDGEGNPVYCQFMSMHWGVNDANDTPEVVAEVRQYLTYATHFFAECQAVNAFENLDPHGYFLTPNGFEIDSRPTMFDFDGMDTPFGQIDGEFGSVGGSEPSYTLPDGDSYKASDIVMITRAGTPEGDGDIWMTGALDGVCEVEAEHGRGLCLSTGKVSYLGGHEYSTDLPISENPTTQGTRLFLNSLFEAPCATLEGAPALNLEKQAPAYTATPQVTYTLSYENPDLLPVLDVVISDPIPAGATVTTINDGGSVQGNDVVWDIGNVAPSSSGSVSFTVEFDAYGTYPNVASASYRVGVNTREVESNEAVTLYDDEPPDSDGSSGSGGTSDTDASTGSDASISSGGSDGDGSTASDTSAGTSTASSTDGTADESSGANESGEGSGGSSTGSGSEASESGSGGSGGGSGTGGGDEASSGETHTSADGDETHTTMTTDTEGAGAEEATSDGCGCRSRAPIPTPIGFSWLLLLGLGAIRRRR